MILLMRIVGRRCGLIALEDGGGIVGLGMISGLVVVKCGWSGFGVHLDVKVPV